MSIEDNEKMVEYKKYTEGEMKMAVSKAVLTCVKGKVQKNYLKILKVHH